ncbi:hypothetical protein FRB99_002789 [Tulasnella sp. 403]|nr:hypothetical protein FRB99_002789 [Tulasnella sp. 403]
MITLISAFFILSLSLKLGTASPLTVPRNQHLEPSSLSPRMFFKCRFQDSKVPTTIELTDVDDPESERSLRITYLGRGATGCVYNVLEDSSGMTEPAVVKTPLKGCYTEDEIEHEVSVLGGVRQLLFNGAEKNSGARWYVMKKAVGVTLWEHPEYTKKYPQGYNLMDPTLSYEQRTSAINDCSAFMLSWYQLVVDAIGNALLQYGWEYKDINWENFLFSTGSQPRVTLVDWAMAEQVPDDQKESRWASLQQELWDQLAGEQSSMPVYDDQYFQGICQSDQRDVLKKKWVPIPDAIRRAIFENSDQCSIM